MIQRGPSLLNTWIFVFIIPMTYVLLLPSLSTYNPFRKGTFASTNNHNKPSLSALVQTPQSNGGLAVCTSPFVNYVWYNPLITDTGQTYMTTIGSILITSGWAMTIVFPLNFAPGNVHVLSFIVGLIGIVIYTFGIVFKLRRPYAYSLSIIAISILGCEIVALLAYSINGSVLFFAMEYIIFLKTQEHYYPQNQGRKLQQI